jgi:hypothetical protein
LIYFGQEYYLQPGGRAIPPRVNLVKRCFF